MSNENNNSTNNCQNCPPSVKVEAVQVDVTELKMEDKRIHERIDKVIDTMNEKLNDNSKEIKDVERRLSDRMLTLEVTYKLNTESINLGITNLGKKIDEMAIESKKTIDTKSERSYEWVKWILMALGIIVIEYGASKLGLK